MMTVPTSFSAPVKPSAISETRTAPALPQNCFPFSSKGSNFSTHDSGACVGVGHAPPENMRGKGGFI